MRTSPQFYTHDIAAIDLEDGIIAPTVAATLYGAPGGTSANQALALCGSGRHLYASAWLAPALVRVRIQSPLGLEESVGSV